MAAASSTTKVAATATVPKSEVISTKTYQKTDATRKKAEIIGEDEVATEEELPYDTTTKTGKLAAALMTGKIQILLYHRIQNQRFTVLGTKYVTKQLATGVVMAENLIGQVSKNVQDKMVPNPEPTKINKGLHVTARGLRTTSGAAFKASSYVGKCFK